jgi:hypothetical protein
VVDAWTAEGTQSVAKRIQAYGLESDDQETFVKSLSTRVPDTISGNDQVHARMRVEEDVVHLNGAKVHNPTTPARIPRS